jgi:hypothetical protein
MRPVGYRVAGTRIVCLSQAIAPRSRDNLPKPDHPPFGRHSQGASFSPSSSSSSSNLATRSDGVWEGGSVGVLRQVRIAPRDRGVGDAFWAHSEGEPTQGFSPGLRFAVGHWHLVTSTRANGSCSSKKALASLQYQCTYVPMSNADDRQSQVEIERIQTGVRLEKRLLKVLKAVAELKDMSLGDLLEGIVLHAFEGKSAFTRETLKEIEQLKTIYGLTLSAEDSHKLRERSR